MSTITHINPSELHTNPAYSQATLAPAGQTLYIGGQNGTDSTGAIVEGGVAAQSAQAMRNVLTILAAANAGPESVVKMTVYLAEGEDLQAAFAASIQVWGQQPTAITVVRVAGLGRPEALVEIDAIALVG
jgi:enamine deaminase RidA (YjgF/YER057c/UK114 family)